MPSCQTLMTSCSKSYGGDVTTLTRPVLGDEHNSSGNLEILSGIFLGKMI